ncbi:MAG: DUF2231 domain-containing protein [Sphingomonadales bacterium]
MMHPTTDHRRFVPIYPLHAVLLAGMLPLFLGALLSDIAYSATYEPQWANFSSWLIVGAMILCGFTLLWAAVDLIRSGGRERQSWLYVALLSACFVLGFIGALIHAKDAWATMPAGLTLSVAVAMLAVAATWVGFWGIGQGPAK